MSLVMKILVLNPHFDAEHEVLVALRSQGAAILQPGDANEAFQMLQLHGKTVDLAILHREGVSESAQQGVSTLGLISKLKKDTVQADLPIILTSEKWADSEFAGHQTSVDGVNAYLKYPFSIGELTQLLEGVLGTQFRPVHGSSDVAANPPGVVLEDGTSVHTNSSFLPAVGDLSIQLEMPGHDASSVSSPVAPSVVPEVASQPATGDNDSGLELDLGFNDQSASQSAGSHSTESSGLEIGSIGASDGGTLMLEQTVDRETAQPQEPIEAALPITPVEFALETPVFESPGTVAELAVNPENLFSLGVPSDPPTAELSGEGQESSQESNENLPDDLRGDHLAQEEMPYLFAPGPVGSVLKSGPSEEERRDVAQRGSFTMPQPIGDSIIPGGASKTPDQETLKHYLLLREQDVASLAMQLKSATARVSQLEEQISGEKAKSASIGYELEEKTKQLSDFDLKMMMQTEVFEKKLSQAEFEAQSKADKAKVLETQVKEALAEVEKIKERVRIDIRKIRVREKELENRLEIIRKDSEALLTARETKIIELKRKIDLLEFNMDLLQDQYNREKELNAHLRERIIRVTQAVKVAGGILDQNQVETAEREALGIKRAS